MEDVQKVPIVPTLEDQNVINDGTVGAAVPNSMEVGEEVVLLSQNDASLELDMVTADLIENCEETSSSSSSSSANGSTTSTEPILPADVWLLDGPPQVGGRPTPYLIFRSSALANPSELSIQDKPASKLHITYKALQAETKLLSKLLTCHGITEVSAHCNDFNLLWTGSHPKPGLLRNLTTHQRVNHFPRSYELTRKDRLYKNIERMQHAIGYKHFDFIPQTFLMPGDYADLCSTHHRVKGPWIVKPVASSRGRGIFIVETPHEVPLDEPVVVAKYIGRPMLVAGHKCDLRLYVVVTSFDPLLVYIYEEGLVRFATVKYDASHKQLWNPCMHLCNYSINKYHSDYVKSDDPTAENVGHKWTLSALLRHLKADGKDTAVLMSQIEDLIIKAILASGNSIVAACKMFITHSATCFELYGFDILIDADLKPWLLEVNLSPSLGCDSPLDVRLKSAMLADLLTLVGIPAIDPILRPSQTSIITSSSNSNKVSGTNTATRRNCRRVNSADTLTSVSKKSNSQQMSTTSSQVATTEELRIIRNARAQFNRRGGFVRIFPAADSWLKYAQYLDPTTGIPISGNPTTDTFTDPYAHNLNLLLFTHLFPDIPVSHHHNHHHHHHHHHHKMIANESRMNASSRVASLDRRKDIQHQLSMSMSSDSSSNHNNHDNHVLNSNAVIKSGEGVIVTAQQRQDRYERMLSQGHKAALPSSTPSIRCSDEVRRSVLDLLRDGKKLSQCETRRTFSHYLACVLKRMSAASGSDQDHQIDVVLKFLHKASNYLRTPFYVKSPGQQLDSKDRAAIIAKQLNDFLYLYNRETEPYITTTSSSVPNPTENANYVPTQLYSEFLDHAHETDLEEILIYQTATNTPQMSTMSITGPTLTARQPPTRHHHQSRPLLANQRTISGGGFPHILKCLPHIKGGGSAAVRTHHHHYKPLGATGGGATKSQSHQKTLKISSLS